MTTDIYMALDLEMNQPSGKIIQIGVCAGNIRTGEIIAEDEWYVLPNEPLRADIVKLTGISEDKLAAEGMSLVQAYCFLRAFVDDHKPFMNPLTWGGGDSVALIEQVKAAAGMEIPNLFGRRWIDIKTLHIANRIRAGKSPQGGLARSMLQYGLKFEGRKHDALDDARNTFRLAHQLIMKPIQ